jgi:hypothetical protein
MRNLKINIVLLFAVFGTNFFSQNKQIAYGFAELPQTLILNPGAEVPYKFHIGMPFLSGLSSSIGSTGFVLSDLFASDNKAFNDKFSLVLNKLDVTDHLKIHSQIEIINAGYQFNDKTYFSFGFYQEIDGIIYFPKDVLLLIREGNSAHLDKSFELSQVSYKLDAFGALHFGVSRKINNRLRLGARFKLYSSALNVQSFNNSGTFRTEEGTNNVYTHHLTQVDLNLKTSGLVSNDEYIEDPKTYIGNTFFGDNMGIGVDLGFTYKLSEQLEITGSFLDVGFIRHKKNTKSLFAKGAYIFEGIELEYDPLTSKDYWRALEVDFNSKLPYGENLDSYTSFLTGKMNASIKYNFKKRKRLYCYDGENKKESGNAVGVQLFSIFRPLRPQFAVSGFYEKSFSEKIRTKITYTIDDYSYYNIGAGISVQFGNINLYGLVDNVAEFSDIASAKSISFQLGANLIF